MVKANFGNKGFSSFFIKRIFDIILSSLLLVMMLPVFFVLAVLIRYKLGRPILFRQQRPGFKGVPFTLLKFRTMIDKTINEDGSSLSEEQRMTKFGQFLRSSSLDELPELWNVIKGDMSIVGPRPLLLEYLPLYNAEQMIRHNVLPGITGWAQVNGRNAISWHQKFKFDIYYVQNFSLKLDIKIIFLTIKKVILKEGITSENHVTAEKFTGEQ